MSNKEGSLKWTRIFLVIVAGLLSYVLAAFITQLGAWFDLEAKISHFAGLSQATSIGIGLVAFLVAMNSSYVRSYLDEVYGELTKVVWSDRETTIKLTFGIMIGLVIVSIFLGLTDLLIRKVFNLLY